MKIYISGQITGLKEKEAKIYFDRAEKMLLEKGYNPVNQIVGYLMSGDPTYITSYNGARSLVMKVERDELVEELLPGDAVKVTIEELEDGSRVIRL